MKEAYAESSPWRPVGDNTYLADFMDTNGYLFTCIMVKGGGGMAGEVKTLACPGVIYVPISKKESLQGVEKIRPIMPMPRRLPVLPE